MADELLPVPELSDPVDPISYGKYRIAMVINGVVHQVLNLEASDAARYLSEPVFIQIPRSLNVVPGDLYNGTTFSPKE
jgi:hypothetical protein